MHANNPGVSSAMPTVEASRPASIGEASAGIALLPLMLVVLVAFVVIGMALPVLPLHVHDGLGFGAAMVGLVAGSQFAASLVSRVCSGRTCDGRGPKRAVIIGLAGTTVAGLLYLLSLRFAGSPQVSVVILLAGRAVLGGAESFIITDATVWGLAPLPAVPRRRARAAARARALPSTARRDLPRAVLQLGREDTHFGSEGPAQVRLHAAACQPSRRRSTRQHAE